MYIYIYMYICTWNINISNNLDLLWSRDAACFLLVLFGLNFQPVRGVHVFWPQRIRGEKSLGKSSDSCPHWVWGSRLVGTSGVVPPHVKSYQKPTKCSELSRSEEPKLHCSTKSQQLYLAAVAPASALICMPLEASTCQVSTWAPESESDMTREN